MRLEIQLVDTQQLLVPISLVAIASFPSSSSAFRFRHNTVQKAGEEPGNKANTIVHGLTSFCHGLAACQCQCHAYEPQVEMQHSEINHAHACSKQDVIFIGMRLQ